MTDPVDFPSRLSAHMDSAFLSGVLAQSIRKTVFFSGLMVAPRLIDQIAQELTASFFRYHEDRDDQTVRVYGGTLAYQGFGPKTVLTSCDTLSRVCREKSNPLQDLPDLAGCYTSALLEGYIDGREQRLLLEQERTLRAYLAAAARQTSAND